MIYNSYLVASPIFDLYECNTMKFCKGCVRDRWFSRYACVVTGERNNMGTRGDSRCLTCTRHNFRALEHVSVLHSGSPVRERVVGQTRKTCYSNEGLAIKTAGRNEMTHWMNKLSLKLVLFSLVLLLIFPSFDITGLNIKFPPDPLSIYGFFCQSRERFTLSLSLYSIEIYLRLS